MPVIVIGSLNRTQQHGRLQLGHRSAHKLRHSRQTSLGRHTSWARNWYSSVCQVSEEFESFAGRLQDDAEAQLMLVTNIPDWDTATAA